MNNSKTVAVITGGTSGIGKATAYALANKGVTVYTISRSPVKEQAQNHICADVSNEAQLKNAIDQVMLKEGQINILINNAGYGISGACEFTNNSDAKKLIDVNLFGVVNGCKAVIPIMREQKCGTIINISSFAAVAPIPFQAWYTVSKAAVSAYTTALLNEVRPFNIQVTSVLPGDIKTGFTQSRQKSTEGDKIYLGRIEKSVSKMEQDEKNGMAPEAAGRFIAKLALKKRVKPEYTIGISYKALYILVKILPARLKAYILWLLYGK